MSSSQLDERHRFVEQLQSYTNSDVPESKEDAIPVGHLSIKKAKKAGKKKASPQIASRKFIETTPEKIAFYSSKVSPRYERVSESVSDS